MGPAQSWLLHRQRRAEEEPPVIFNKWTDCRVEHERERHTMATETGGQFPNSNRINLALLFIRPVSHEPLVGSFARLRDFKSIEKKSQCRCNEPADGMRPLIISALVMKWPMGGRWPEMEELQLLIDWLGRVRKPLDANQNNQMNGRG